jgi:hypothetical protein
MASAPASTTRSCAATRRSGSKGARRARSCASPSCSETRIDELLDEAKRVAEQSGCTLRELLEISLRRELDRRRTAKPFKLRDASVGGKGLRPGVREEHIRWYSYIGQPGFPETIDAMNKLLDERYGRSK